MLGRSLLLMVFCLLGASRPAFAEGPLPLFTDDDGPLELPTLYDEPPPEEPPEAPAKPMPLVANKPQKVNDPAASDWGNFKQPLATPFSPPTVEYLLAPPPRRVFNHGWTNTYEQPIRDPEESYTHGPYFAPGVELYRPDGLAPIGVWGDHTLEAGGEVLVSYRYTTMTFDGTRDGTSELSDAEVLAGFPIAPTHMHVQRHLALLEWAPTDNLTLLAMLPYYDISINHVNRAGTPIREATTDPGDITVQALYVLRRWDCQQVHLNFGLQMPLGVLSADRFAPVPGSPDDAYPLRVTSGTWDLVPGLTYRGQTNDWTWGAQAMGTIRLGINRWDYKLGDRLDLTAWLARRLTDNLSLSARIDGNLWGRIRGADPRLDTSLVPTNRPDDQAGGRIDILFGMNFYLPGDTLPGQWLSIEGGVPIYQSLTGPQLETDWLLHAGWNLRF